MSRLRESTGYGRKMMAKRWLVLLIGTALVLVFSSVGVTSGSFLDQETSTGNSLQAWSSILWTQTTQADYNSGILNNVDTSSSAGDVKLAVRSGWYNVGWNYRKKITINHTKVVANLTDFPVLISLASDSDLVSGAQNNGNDILFTSTDGITKLDHEIELYIGSNGRLVAWVRVPGLSSSTDTILYIYYGNSSCGNQQNPVSVWNSSYKAVWHLNEISGTSVKDSTINNNIGTSQNGVTLGALGEIDGAESFDGNVGWTNLGTSSSLNFGASAPFTIEGWFKTTESYGPIVSFRHDTNDGADIDICVGYDGAVSSAGKLMGLVRQDSGSSGYARITGPTVNDGNWHYFVLTRNAGNTIELFCDGVSQGTNSASQSGGAITTNLRALASERKWVQVNFGNSDQRYLACTIDEVRISNVQRPSSWISTCYNNYYNVPSTFYTAGNKEGPYVSLGTIASQVLDTGVAGARWDALFWDKIFPTSTNITFEVRASNTPFAKDDVTLPWILVGGTSPIISGLPSGRYKQWRATLTTSDTSKTPTLNEVRVYYY
jgi:hypothetical protein